MKRKTYQPRMTIGTLLFLIFLLEGVLSAEPKTYRRCVSNFLKSYSTNTTSNKHSWLKTLHDETTCEGSFPACAKLAQPPADASTMEKPYLAAILIVPDTKDDEFLALAASLLVQGFQVTVYDFLKPGGPYQRVEYIQNKVFQQMPCKPDAKLKSLLNVISAIDTAGKSTRKPLDLYMIHRGPPMMDLLVMTMGYPDQNGVTHEDTSFRADILVMDIFNVAGLMMADKYQIPAIAIGAASSLELAIDHHPDWEPAVTLEQFTDGIYSILRQRWQSLMLTNPLITLNSKRRKVGLGPLKRPSDYFLPIVALIIPFIPEEYTAKAKNQDYWNIVHHTGAIQPLCLPCVSAYRPASGWRHSAQHPTIMVSLPPLSSTLDTTSAVLQSIVMGQQLLIMKKRPPFAIVWLDFGDESVSFSAQDDDFTRESTVNLLDSLARHPDTVIFVGHCDSDSLVASMLGISVFCVSSEIDVEGTPLNLLYNETGLMDPTEIPKVLVNDYVRKHGLEGSKGDSSHAANDAESGREVNLRLDGLSHATSLVMKAAETHRRSLPWNSTEEMHKVITSELLDKELPWRAQKKEHYDAFGIIWAWIVVLTTSIYVLVKSLSSPSIERYLGSYIGRFDEVFPDIEESLRMMEHWYLQQAAGESESRVRIALRRRAEKEKKL